MKHWPIKVNVVTETEHRRLCANQGSREKLAAEIIAIAAACGAKWETKENLWNERSVTVTLAKGEWRCTMDFDAQSKVSAFLGHWYSDDPDSNATLPNSFAGAIRGSVNPNNKRKATIVAETFEQFKASVRGGLMTL